MVFMGMYRPGMWPMVQVAREKNEPKAANPIQGRAFPEKEDFGNRAIYELLTNTARTNPDSTCVYFEGKKMSYSKVDEASSKFAAVLTNMGLSKGDRVAIVLPNTPQFLISYFGILKAGGVVVPCNPIYTPKELEHQLKDSGATIVIGLKDVVTEKSKKDGHKVKKRSDLFAAVGESTSKLEVKHVITTSITDYLPALKRRLAPLAGIRKKRRQGTEDFVKLLKAASPAQSFAVVDSKQDVAILQYTGGTTGVSKGAMLTHYNLYSNAAYTAKTFPMTGSDVSMCVLPFFHIYGMTATMNSAIYAGAKLVLLPKFHVEETMKAIEKQRVTLFCAVPAIYIAIINNPKVGKFDLHSVRACMSGGASVPAAVRDKFMELTGGNLVEGYGLSEASPITHCNPVHDGAVKNLSIGLPVTETEARVVDPNDPSKVLPVGEVGELQVRGPQVMKGYWKRPDETEKVLKDGWLLTGDMARMDSDGYFFIVDRKKDMINVGGLKVFPRDVEEVLFSHSSIQDAAVVAVPDSFSGEAVKAFIVVKDKGSAPSEKEIIDYCSQSLAKYKVPKYVEFVDELPKTLIGKVLKRELRNDSAKAQ